MTTDPNSSETRRILKKGLAIMGLTVVVIIIGAVALLKIESDSNQSDESPTLSSLWHDSNGLELIAALALISTAMPFVALRWRALFPKEFKSKSSPLYLTGILCAAFVFNLALPGPVGELLSAGMAQKKTKLPFLVGLSALGVSRIIGLGSACGIAGVLYWVAPFETPEVWSNYLSVAAGGLLFGAIVLGSMVVAPKLYFSIFMKLKPKHWTNGLKGKLVRTVEELLKAMIETANRGKYAYAESIFWALIGHLFVASGIAMAAHSVGVDVSWSAVLFTYAASIAASVAMFMLPASGLAWDALFAGCLKVTGSISLKSAIAITLVVRFQQMMVAGLGLFIVWLMAREMLNVSEWVKNTEKLERD